MQPKQRDYVISRVNGIAEERISNIKDKFTVSLTKEQKYQLVKQGKVKLLPLGDQSAYDGEFKFDFSEFEKDWKDNALATMNIARIEHKAREVRDEIMIGDCDKALKLLKQFEEGK